MPFGKYKGESLENVPESYLLWLLDNCTNLSKTLAGEIRRVLDIGEPAEPSLRELEAQMLKRIMDQ